MKKFERNDLGLMDKEFRIRDTNPKAGKIIKVYEHTKPTDNSNFEVDVVTDGGTDMEPRVPVISTASNKIAVPKVGDTVILHYEDDETPRPHAAEALWTNKDRPPLGLAGMSRQMFESGPSPVGSGNYYITKYTSYNNTVAKENKNEVSARDTVIQVAKHDDANNTDPTENTDPTSEADVPFKFEILDSVEQVDDEMYVTVSGNAIDGDDSNSMNVTIDFKRGEITIAGEKSTDSYEITLDVLDESAEILGDSNSGNKMGASFDFSNDSFKIADGNKFGIESDGSGNFTWSHKSINFVEEGGTTGSIDL
jgi:hypothetical protein